MNVLVEPVPLNLPSLPHKRTVGIHLSSIIRCMAIEGKILQSDDVVEDLTLYGDSRIITDPAAILRIWIGCAWEAFFLPRLLNVIDHPGERYYDGIYLTPDGESVDVYVTETRIEVVHAIHEVKATYKSVNTVSDFIHAKNPLKNWMWLAQLKAYCYQAKTRRGVLWVLFLCGNYKWPITPQIRKYTFDFEQWELEENWKLMKDYVTYRLDDPLLIGV